MRILLADDEKYGIERLLSEVKSALPDATIDIFDDGIPALVAVHKEKYDLVITDISMCGMNGDELARCIHDYDPKVEILFGTGESEAELRQKGIQPERCLLKPVKSIDIRAKLENLAGLPPFTMDVPEAAEKIHNKAAKISIFTRLLRRGQEDVRYG